MKATLIISTILIWMPSIVGSQARITDPLEERLKGKTQFDDIKTEVLNYYKQEKSKLTVDDKTQNRSINRQLKFWNRWFYDSESRLEPDGTVANWSKKMLEIDKEIGSDEYDEGQGRIANSSWSVIGPTNVENNHGIGRVLRMGFHPTSSQTIYAGTARGGLWRSINAGASWFAISAYLPSLGVSGIEVSQTNPNVLYVLSGEGDAWLNGGFTLSSGYISYSNGVFKSTDGGSNWTKTADFFPGIDTIKYVGFQLRQDPNNSSTYMAATSEGMFRTTNGGSSWTTSTFEDLDGNLIESDIVPICAIDVEYKPGNSTIVYAACRTYNDVSEDFRYKFFRSINGGILFEEVDLPVDFQDLIRFEIGVTPASPASVFLLCGPGFVEDGDPSDDSFLGFLKSTNSGVSFSTLATSPDVFAYTQVEDAVVGNQCFYDMALAISPTNANNIFTGGLVVYRSTNGGNSFAVNTSYWDHESGPHIHPDIHDLRFNELDGKLYAATDGGVYVTSNNGDDWSALHNGMSISQFYHSEPDNENDKFWGGTQDNGILQQETGGTFSKFYGGDGFDVMTDNIVGNGNDSYWSLNGAVVTSGNNGDFEITPPDPDTIGRNFGTLDMHPTNEDYIYVGYKDAVWYSNDRGDSWLIFEIYNELAGGDVSGNWCIQTCPSNATRLYAAGDGSMWRVDNINFENSATGADLNLRPYLIAAGFPTNSDGTELRKVTDIVVHPTSSIQFWITAGGFYDGKKVFYSDNGGSNWVNKTYNLPNVPANCLLRDSDGTLYVGMDMGVYYLPPGGTNWKPYYNGLPRVPVSEMNFVGDFIYASTFGRGIWRSVKFTGCVANLTLTHNLKGQLFYQANTSITSTSLVDGGVGTNIYLQAGNSIILNTGFEAKKDIEFTGFIEPCNTGALPLNTNDAGRKINSNEPVPAVIESVISVNDHQDITLNIRKPGKYSIQLLSEEGDWIKVLFPDQDFQSGKVVLKASKQMLPKGFHHIAVVSGEKTLHFQEYSSE